MGVEEHDVQLRLHQDGDELTAAFQTLRTYFQMFGRLFSVGEEDARIISEACRYTPQ